MSFDTSGNFTRSPNGATNWQTDAAAGTRIRADLHDNHDQDIANGLSECLNRNGKGGALADISMQGFKLTNLQDGVNPTDAVNKRQMEAVKTFSTGIIISGADANGRITFTGLGETGLSWNDMFFGVDVANQWWIWNDKADATGNNVLEADKIGRFTQMYKADGSTGGPIHELYRDKVSTSGGANGDTLGMISFTGKDSTNAKTTWATIYGSIEKADNNLEGGSVVISRMIDGVLTPALTTTKDGVTINQKLKVTSDLEVTGISKLLGTVEFNTQTAGAGWRYATGGDGHLYEQYTTGYFWRFNTSGASSGALEWFSNNVLTFRLDYQGAGHFYKGCSWDDTATFLASYDATYKYLQFETGYLFTYTKANGLLSYVCNGGTSTAYTISYNGIATFYQAPIFTLGSYHTSDSGYYLGVGASGRIHQYSPGWYWDWASGNGDLTWIGAGGARHYLLASGNFQISGNTGQKSTGTTWANPSDGRLKNLIGDFKLGLSEIMQVRPRRFSLKADADQREHVGIIGQEIETAFPSTITLTEGEIDGETIPDLRQFDANDVLFAMVNAIKELKGLLDDATARIAALEAA